MGHAMRNPYLTSEYLVVPIVTVRATPARLSNMTAEPFLITIEVGLAWHAVSNWMRVAEYFLRASA